MISTWRLQQSLPWFSCAEPELGIESDLLTSPEDPSERPGYIRDFISNQLVRRTAEEAYATQPFARRLVEELGYPTSHIRTRPQFRVRESPSGRERWPVDIAVFRSDAHAYSDVHMIVECKQPTRRDGRRQLELYLNLCNAQVGVWFNGDEHYYCRKVVLEDGGFAFPEIPTIPRFGQSLSDIGRVRRRDLVAPTDLKSVFRDIRNHLAGMSTGITRDETLAREIINLLFCKIYDEVNTDLDDFTTFHVSEDDSPHMLKRRIDGLFEQRVKTEYSDVFDRTDAIHLDAQSLVYVVGELQNSLITQAPREAIGEAFEVFIGPALRGAEGQFFTPRNVVKMMIDILDPQPDEYIIDPACGSGGFLIAALEHVWNVLQKTAKRRGWSEAQLADERRKVATRHFRGIDKDSFLAKVTKAYMAIVGDGRGGVFCENSLKPPSEWDPRMQWDAVNQAGIGLGVFDLVITNPPFGAKIRVEGESLLAQYKLGRGWVRNRKSHHWEQTSSILDSRPPQVLFVERCLQLLKPGGRLGIVLPESIFGNPSHGFITQFITEQSKLLGIVSMPEDLFQPWTHAKTCIVFLEKAEPPPDYAIFMGICKWCGHDSRGNPIPHDDVPEITNKYITAMQGNGTITSDRYGFMNRFVEVRNNIFIPKYYDPEISSSLESLSETHQQLSVGQLVQDGVLEISTGDEVGKLAYGTGDIPFVRTSDLSNWELKLDPKQGLSEQIYLRYTENPRQDVRPRDIFIVRDGTYLIGTVAMVVPQDGRMLYQSHLYKIRVLRPEVIDPYLLLTILSTPIVRRQIRSKQFTQDIIDTLGTRILELVLPVPKDPSLSERIASATRTVIEERAVLKQRARHLPFEVLGRAVSDEEIALADIV